MKKISILFLSLVVAISMLAAPAFANPWKDHPGKGNSKVQLYNQKVLNKLEKRPVKNFRDVQKHWAKYDIQRVQSMGLMSGYPDGTFKPNSTITSVEAVAIAIRLIDNLYPDVNIDYHIRETDLSNVPGWARSSVMKASALKMINLNRFHSHVQASRAQVMVVLAKALGLEPVKISGIPFKDLKLISSEDLGYILALYKEGFIKGTPNGNFNPNNCITRAELAAILSRIVAYLEDGEFDWDEENEDDRREVAGVITGLEDGDEDDWEITLHGKTYDVNEDVDVYDEDGDRIDFSDLNAGDVVVIHLDDDEVEKIEIVETLAGEITSIGDDEITIKYDNGRKHTFDVDKDVVVVDEKDGYDLEYNDLEKGWDVELKFDDGEVVEITVVERDELAGTCSGIIEYLDEDEIKIDGKKYDLAAGFDIDDYLIGSKVKIYVFNDEVKKIEILNDQNYISVPGEVVEVNDKDWEITIEQDSGNIFTFDVYKHAGIDDDLDFDEIEEGWDVELKLYNGKVYQINID